MTVLLISIAGVIAFTVTFFVARRRDEWVSVPKAIFMALGVAGIVVTTWVLIAIDTDDSSSRYYWIMEALFWVLFLMASKP